MFPPPPALHSVDLAHQRHCEDAIADIMNVSIEWQEGRSGRSKIHSSLNLSMSDQSMVCDTSQVDCEQSVCDPYALASSRKEQWPKVRDEFMSIQLFQIYSRVQQTGLPNMLECRQRVPSQLRRPAWHGIATGHHDDRYVIDGIEFGFPLHYTGPTMGRPNRLAHASATNYKVQVGEYVRTETKNQAMLGPFDISPFMQWINFSPIMTRPKSEPHKRRIIVDLSFPQGDNVNAFIYKNTILGRYHEHRLPTVQHTVAALEARGFRALLATIDIERAYRNIPVCPLDLPLLGIKVDDKIYIDAAMPFGARNSSLNMQMIAQFIVRALEERGISCQMYLDDMVLQLSPEEDYHARFREVMALYRFLGLPISYSKIQPPAECVTYLGIRIDIPARTMHIPEQKLRDTVELTRWATTQESITKTMAQRIVGKLNHVSRCVESARLFTARILRALREAHHMDTVPVSGMKPDLHWFGLFARRFNGRSIMKTARPNKVILADSCLTGGGGTDMQRYYELVYSPALTQTHHISTLEAINCLVAMRTLITAQDRSTTVEVRCDSASAIAAFSFGRARDPVLLAVARAAWYLVACMDLRVIYTHIPGEQMDVPDSLSRAHLSPQHRAKADQHIRTLSLSRARVKCFATNYSNYL